MKLAVDVHHDVPLKLKHALNHLYDYVKKESIDACLEVIGRHDTKGWGPAEFYIQHYQIGFAPRLFVRVELNGVSLGKRKLESLQDARERLEDIYVEVIKRYLPKKTALQLQVVIVLDVPISEGRILKDYTSLLETKPGEIWVHGEYEEGKKPFEGRHLKIVK